MIRIPRISQEVQILIDSLHTDYWTFEDASDKAVRADGVIVYYGVFLGEYCAGGGVVRMNARERWLFCKTIRLRRRRVKREQALRAKMVVLSGGEAAVKRVEDDLK